MNVNELIQKLRAYTKEHPMNGFREVYLRVDGRTLYQFNEARNGDDPIKKEGYFIMCPSPGSRVIEMQEANLNA